MDPHTMISTAGQRTDGLTSQGHRLVSISTPILWPPSNLNRFQMSFRFRLVHLQSSEYNISLKFLKSNLILVVLMECHISPVPSVTFIWINNSFCVFLPSLKVFILKFNQQCRYNLVLRQKESFLKWFFTNLWRIPKFFHFFLNSLIKGPYNWVYVLLYAYTFTRWTTSFSLLIYTNMQTSFVNSIV